jgi:hypothetical protein
MLRRRQSEQQSGAMVARYEVLPASVSCALDTETLWGDPGQYHYAIGRLRSAPG